MFGCKTGSQAWVSTRSRDPKEETIAMAQEKAYLPIEDYGLIGNCYTAALISSRGSLDWLCMPCFDSSSIFASILDIGRGGSWSIHPTASCRSEHRYLEYTNVLETIFVCGEGRVRLLDFMPVSSEAASGTVYPPIAVIRIIEGLDGEIEIESHCRPRPDYGLSFPTFEAQGRRVAFDRYTVTGPVNWRVDEIGGTVSCRIAVRPGERLAFILSHEGGGRFPSAQIEDPDHLAARGDRRRAQLGLPLHLDPRRFIHPLRPPARRLRR